MNQHLKITVPKEIKEKIAKELEDNPGKGIENFVAKEMANKMATGEITPSDLSKLPSLYGGTKTIVKMLGGKSAGTWVTGAVSQINKVYEKISKELRLGPYWSGIHCHGLEREEGKARLCGYHGHIYVIPTLSGIPEVIFTDYDGTHSHDLSSFNADITKHGGEHQHVVKNHYEIHHQSGFIIKEGSVAITERGGGHSHGANNVYHSDTDGVHEHNLIVKDGDESLEMETVGISEFLAIFEPVLCCDIPDFNVPNVLETIEKDIFSQRKKDSMLGLIEKESNSLNDLIAASFGEKIEKEGKVIDFELSEISTITISKKKHKTSDAVNKALDSMGISKTATMEETDDSFIVVLEKKDRFKKLKAVKLVKGITAMIGKRSNDGLANKVKKEDDKDQGYFLKVAKSLDEDKRVVIGVVLEPNDVDAEGDTMTAADIEESMHAYMINYRVIGFRHKAKAPAVLVEAYIAPVTFTISGHNGKQKVIKGSWVQAVKILDEDLWQDIKDKKINGFSVGGEGRRQKLK